MLINRADTKLQPPGKATSACLYRPIKHLINNRILLFLTESYTALKLLDFGYQFVMYDDLKFSFTPNSFIASDKKTTSSI